jgi:outer membrane protein assembly factor BamB
MDHNLYAVNALTGSEIWRFSEANSALAAMPAADDDTLYVGSLSGQMYAIDAQTGTAEWTIDLEGGLWTTPLLEEGTLYFGTLGGKVHALDATDGSEVWSAEVGGEVRGTPVLVNGVLYTGCEDGQLYAFDASNGMPQISPLGNAAEGASIFTSPVYDGNQLYVVATNGEVFALNLEANQVVWRNNPLNSE